MHNYHCHKRRDSLAETMATNDKYDRQLRLWGSHGQKALMDAHLLLITADGSGTETLKNLVLPGVGRFTIMDHNDVAPSDCTSSFFLTENFLGKNRAETACALLKELNPDVSGYYDTRNIAEILDVDGGTFFSQFTLVIASNLNESLLVQVSKLCSRLCLPLVAVRAYGLIGYCRVQTSGVHEIIESKPMTDLPDLRILHPFDDLLSYCNSIDVHAYSDHEHAHMPYIIILVRAIAKWRDSHGGDVPSSDLREEFKQTVLALSRYPDLINSGKLQEELNFTESSREIFQALRTRNLPEAVETYGAIDFSAPLTLFKVLVAALQVFMARSGHPPLAGMVPDMLASTEQFIKLQEVYMKKATEDRLAMREIVDDILKSASSNGSHSIPLIDDDLIDRFCKNCYNLQVVSTRSIEEEFTAPNVSAVMEAFMDPYEDAVQTPILWYLALRAADRFHSKTNRFPGVLEGGNDEERATNMDTDTESVWLELRQLAEEVSAQTECEQEQDCRSSVNDVVLRRSHAQEITRVGAAELHNIAALIGGIAAQEIVKLITHQYIPMNNTYIFNGISGVGAKYEL